MATKQPERTQDEALQPDDMRNTSHADVPRGEIARRAYERYEERGRQPGRELEDWLEAEKDVQQRQSE